MRPVDIEFVAPKEEQTWLRRLNWVLSLLALASLSVYWWSERELDRARQAYALAQQKASQKAAEAASAALAPARLGAADRQMLKELTSPWPDWLSALEAVEEQGIQITELEIDASSGTGRVRLQFSDFGVLSRYVERLGQYKPAAGVWRLEEAARTAGGGTERGAASISITAVCQAPCSDKQ